MKVFFVGSRTSVYEALQALDLDTVLLAAVKGSPLQSRLQEDGVKHLVLQEKAQLLDAVARADFDLLVSNGCPWILPVSSLQKPAQIYVNVHPSLLPNLRGKHPLNGAVLLDQPVGASCHLMDDGVDTGAVISRVHVDTGKGVDLGLLYRLAFLAEADAFRLAYGRRFKPGAAELGDLSKGSMYFNRTADAMRIRLSDPIALTVRRVAAFSVPGQMARLECRDAHCSVAHAEEVKCAFIEARFRHVFPDTLLFKYDDKLVIKLNDGYLRLSGVTGAEALREGMQLTSPLSSLNQSLEITSDAVQF